MSGFPVPELGEGPACDHRRVNDWEQFLREVSWFVQPGDTVTVGETRPLTRGSVAGLPELSALLGLAALTPVRVADDAYELMAWGPRDARRGWLCRPPRGAVRASVPPVHRSFWAVCGGIVERFGDPGTWWENQNEVLTADAARVPVADAVGQYGWLWEEDGMEITVNLDEYYAVAVEANGNLTLAHRDDGRLLLFAPDHSFTRVTPLAGSPPYSLLTIDNVPDLATWIEVSAAAWRQQ